MGYIFTTSRYVIVRYCVLRWKRKWDMNWGKSVRTVRQSISIDDDSRDGYLDIISYRSQSCVLYCNVNVCYMT